MQFDDYFDKWVKGYFNIWVPLFQDGKLELDMPGVSKDSISITAEDGILHVSGARGSRKYTHVADLPANVDVGLIKAEFKDGVLSITLPKETIPSTKKIQIKVS